MFRSDHHSDGDIIGYQAEILGCESGACLAFHIHLNGLDEHRRFCIMGALGMAEGDIVRGYLKAAARDRTVIADYDYTKGDPAQMSAHYGADHMMVVDIISYLLGETKALSVGVIDALEAGWVAVALDQARISGGMVDLTQTCS